MLSRLVRSVAVATPHSDSSQPPGGLSGFRTGGALSRIDEPAGSTATTEHLPLRLTVTSGLLGIELYEPVHLGPLCVSEISATLNELPKPVDLSGGVRTFRHRRGELERLVVSSDLEALRRWIRPKARELLGGLSRDASVWFLENGLGIGIVGKQGALAIDLLWAPSDGTARLVLSAARGAGLRGPAMAEALRLVDTLFGSISARSGRVISFKDVAGKLGRAIFPALGARAPGATGVRFGPLEQDADEYRVEMGRSLAREALSDPAARALELAQLTREADDALSQGDAEKARGELIAALEQAPRHPELARLIAELDVFCGGRAEAALGILVDSLAATDSGVVGAVLMARVGDLEGAREAVRAVARTERFAPVGASLWLELGALETDAARRLEAIDEAVAVSPGFVPARWSRFAARVRFGQVEAALADAEHLEALALGSVARHEVNRRVAAELLEAGFVRDAGRAFERALRFVPDDAGATTGLALSLLESGKHDRAVALLQRAIELGEDRSAPESEALVALGRLLATKLRDLPQAIARVRAVPMSSPRVAEARALEARWRAAIGDIAGASVGYAKLREVVELGGPRDNRDVADWLLEAGRFERDVANDISAAEKHLALALRIAPRNAAVAEAYRATAAVLARKLRPKAEPIQEVVEVAGQELAVVESPVESEVSLEQEAEELKRRLMAGVSDLAGERRLVELLTSLGRDDEVFAFISARVAEDPRAGSSRWSEAMRAVLTRLIRAAEDSGRGEEAKLYRQALERYSKL